MGKSKKVVEKVYRQGDVLIRKVASIPKGVKPIELDKGRIVLAYGEVTGHAHAIVDPNAAFVINSETQQRYLECKAPVELKHEEHSKIELPAGNYEIVQQKEYTPMGLRNVAD